MPLPTMKEFIWDEFMEPLNISVKQMAHDIDVPEAEIQDVLDGKKEVSAELSIKLGRYFNVSDSIFFDIQKDIDMRKAQRMSCKELKKSNLFLEKKIIFLLPKFIVSIKN